MEENKKKKISIIITSVLLVMLLIISASYAYFSSKSVSSEKEVQAGTLRIVYTDNTEGTVEIDNIIPIYDNEIKTKANKFAFNIDNTGTSQAYVDIKLTDIVMDPELSNLEFKWALYSGDTKISNGNFRNITNNEVLLTKNIELPQSNNKDYELYIWISENDLDQSTLMNKSFKCKITVEGNQEKSADLLSTVIKNNNSPIVEATPDFNTTATTDEGLIKGIDDDGETYYFRGAVEDNYVKIGDMETLWRIVRVNGDGTTRLISDEIVGNSAFNTSFNNEKYLGYTYDNSAPNVQDGTSSTIKTYLENWYTTNMSEYDNLIASTRYCNDTSVSEVDRFGYIYYGARGRLANNKSPQFTCPNTEKTNGGEYDLKIGLLTADEAAFAGGKYYSSNKDYYLQKGDWYWLGTPSYFSGINASGFGVDDSGDLHNHFVGDSGGVVPVLNLRSDVLYSTGDGTKTNPYIVNLDSIA